MIVVVLGVSFKVDRASLNSMDVSSDPIKGLKNYYAGLIWESFEKKVSLEDKFTVVSRALEYDPELKPAYLAICRSYGDYLRAKISVRDFTRLLKDAVDRFGSTDFLECYTGSMVLLGRYSDAIHFLEREMDQAIEAQKLIYDAKIKSLKNEKNILDLTKAMESYFQKHKSYPGDILVLVSEGYIGSIPEDPYGGQYFIGEQGQIMSTSSRRS